MNHVARQFFNAYVSIFPSSFRNYVGNSGIPQSDFARKYSIRKYLIVSMREGGISQTASMSPGIPLILRRRATFIAKVPGSARAWIPMSV